MFAADLCVACSPAVFDPDVAAIGPAQNLQALQESGDTSLIFRIVRSGGNDHPDAPHPLALLRPRGKRPRCRRAAKQRDELAALHSITSSARSKNDSGIASPSAFAVVRLRTRSNLVGCSTGSSPGLAPRKILST